MALDYDTAVKSADVVIVDFYANWCGPCRALAPTLEEIAKQDGISLVKVNIDEETDLAAKHNISSIPTLKIYKGGEEKVTIVGMQSKDKLQAQIDNLN